MPEGMELGLEQTLIYDPSNFVFPFGTHVCVVDVDPETGKVDVVRWVAVDDCGPAVNPMLIDGQVHGGVAHGIGQAIYEQVVYDERGQLVTGTFVDYALPTAAEMPSFETDRTETKSPSNSLGVKGIGEAGTIAATPAIVNAVIDALRHEGISYIDMPLTPLRVWQALEEARGRGDGPRATEQGVAAARAGRGLGRLRTHDPRRRCGMIAAEFDYAVADSVDDAISLLAEGGADAKLLAGGHSLLPLMKLRFAAPSLLVDMRKLDELRGIQTGDDSFRIGALTRHAELQAREDMGLIAAVATKIADQQVRNRGTIGGSLSHGDSAADLPAMLLALDGSVTRARARRRARDRGRRHVRGLPDDGGRARARCSREVRLPALAGYGYGYEKFNRRAEDWAMVGVCALVKVDRRRLRGRAHRPDAHGVDAAARERGGGRAARPAAATPSTSRRRRSSPRRARARSATSTPRRTTSATSRGC